MGGYKRLTKRDRQKLEFYKKSKKIALKSFKWWAIFSGIACLFIVGIVAFYMFIDSKKITSSQETLFSNQKQSDRDEKNSENLNELSKKELERESAKNESVDKEASKKSVKKDQNDNEPEKTEEKIYDFSQWNKSCPRHMTVINKNNPVSDSMQIGTKLCRGKQVAREIFEDLENMISDAKKQGVNLWISSGYRDVSLQTKLFNRQVEREKSKVVISQEEAEKRASKIVAKPGTSEHNTGLAVDFNGVENNFYTTKEYKWLMDNAHHYGFIERYQKKWKGSTGIIYEPWHFRYVGKENAPRIKESGLCLEEYVQKIM